MLDGIYNAKVEYFQLGQEDHGCLTCFLGLVHEHGHQGFGGYNLMSLRQKQFNPTGGDYCGWWIKRILEICEAEDINLLVGKAIRIKTENERIVAIGNLIKDDWFEPRVDFKKE